MARRGTLAALAVLLVGWGGSCRFGPTEEELSRWAEPAASAKNEAVYNVRDFGATGDGATDDTAAIQAAVNAVDPQAGGTVFFPAGTYIVTIVYVKPPLTLLGEPGAIIKKKAMQDEWCRSFTTTRNRYFGAQNSPPLVFRGLTFDGNRLEQGPYEHYELEHAAMIFLMADVASPGKLTAVVEDCTFHDGTADAISAYTNVSLRVDNCTATDVFRGGVVITGGNTDAVVTRFTANGAVHRTGTDFEVDAAGYGGSYAIDVVFEDIHLRGDFDCAVRDGGRFVGRNITVDESPFLLYARDATIEISDSTFGIGSDNFGNRLYFPENVTFRNCTFTAKKMPDDNGTSFKVMHIYTLTGYYSGTDQTATFDNCTWDVGEGIGPADTLYAVYTELDQLPLNNHLYFTNCRITGGYDYGVYLSSGGRATLTNVEIDAATALRWSYRTDYNSYLDVVVDNVTFGPSLVTSEYMYNSHPNCNITHRNMTLTRAQNTFGTRDGLANNSYHEGRLVLGSVPPGTNTPGLLGDRYRLDSLPGPGAVYQWRCTVSHHLAAAWQAEQHVPAADNGTLAVEEGAAAAGTLVARDADNDTLTFRIINPPSHGEVEIIDTASGEYIYRPAFGYVGPDNFTFRAKDALADSNLAIVAVTVTPIPPQVGGWSIVAFHAGPGEIVTPVDDGYVEPRVMGIRKLIVAFDRPMDTSQIDGGLVAIDGAKHGDQSALVNTLGWNEEGTQLTIALAAALPDQDRYTVTLSADFRSHNGAALTGKRDLVLKALIGNASGDDDDVDNGDMVKIRNARGLPLSPQTARYDLNGSGQIDNGDIIVARNNRGHTCL